MNMIKKLILISAITACFSIISLNAFAQYGYQPSGGVSQQNSGNLPSASNTPSDTAALRREIRHDCHDQCREEARHHFADYKACIDACLVDKGVGANPSAA